MTARPADWFVVVPPDGAARLAGLETAYAVETLLGPGSCKVFDSKKYLDFFNNQLKRPEETLIVDLYNHALFVQCLESGAANLLACALCPLTLFTLNLLKKQNVKTYHWFYEDFRKAQYWEIVLSGYDHFFAIQKGPLPLACKNAGSSYAFLPTAASHHCCMQSLQGDDADASKRPVDIAFIGIPSSYRVEMLEYFAAQGLSLAIAGMGWQRYSGPLGGFVVNCAWTNAAQAASILANAKIGINLSISSPEADRADTHVSPRVFDVLASGCVLVTEDVPLAKETLNDLHYYSFKSKEDAAQVLFGVLAGYEAEKPFFKSNRIKVCAEHTYVNRVREIIAHAQTAPEKREHS